MAEHQPLKLAAVEAHFETSSHVPLLIGGLPDEATGEVRYAIRIPSGLSLLVGHDPETVIPGLDDYPRELWPPVLLTHAAFQIMVGLGFFMMGVGALFLDLAVAPRRRATVAAGGGACWPRRRGSWRWRRAGSSRRWGASRGSSTRSCARRMA